MLIAALQGAPALALPDTETPTLSLARTIRTTPFVGTAKSIRDGEGSAFVPNQPGRPNKGGTDSLWLIDDNGRSVWEVNPHTGGLKSRIDRSDWVETPRFRCPARKKSCQAGKDRSRDLESMAYDQAADVLFVFSGKRLGFPTVYRLTRRPDGSFAPRSFQPLPPETDFTAAAWNPGDGFLYVAKNATVYVYDYKANVAGPAFQVADIAGIFSIAFADGDLFAVTEEVRLSRVDWATKTLRSGWTFDLTPYGIADPRGVEVIADPSTGNDQFYVLDGYDLRASGDPLSHAVFVLDVSASPTA
jgi:hypothetical protein